QKVWRHLNFFQYRCYIHARVPRIECEQHKVRLVMMSPRSCTIPQNE
ncbi:MAG: transposase family protein, partial [Spirochaetia bacterium]|nr:transposase family protein [Spirochaetia bacterium]